MKNSIRVSVLASAALMALSLSGSGQAQQNNMTFFITSAGPGKGADLGGLAGADAHCQQLAQAAGAGGKTWRAYLSTNQGAQGGPVNARDRIGNGPWQNAKGAVIASAITRMITRVVAGEAVRRTTDDGVLGLLLSLGTQATLTAVDTPDTRSWETLPARVAIGRIRVRPGQHQVMIFSRSERRTRTLNLPPNGWGFAGLTVLR